MFGWLEQGRSSLAAQRADGTASPDVLVPDAFWTSSFHPDGRQLAALDNSDILIANLEKGQAAVRPLFQTAARERSAEFSPDGRWLAYQSNESGRFEIWMRPYPGPGEPELIGEGENPAWHPTHGRELFFVSPRDPSGKRRMMVVDFAAGSPHPTIGRPRVLFPFDPTELLFACMPVRCYDVAHDGQRFYVVRTPAPPSPPVVTHINLIDHWFEELKAKVPRQ